MVFLFHWSTATCITVDERLQTGLIRRFLDPSPYGEGRDSSLVLCVLRGNPVSSWLGPRLTSLQVKKDVFSESLRLACTSLWPLGKQVALAVGGPAEKA